MARHCSRRGKGEKKEERRKKEDSPQRAQRGRESRKKVESRASRMRFDPSTGSG